MRPEDVDLVRHCVSAWQGREGPPGADRAEDCPSGHPVSAGAGHQSWRGPDVVVVGKQAAGRWRRTASRSCCARGVAAGIPGVYAHWRLSSAVGVGVCQLAKGCLVTLIGGGSAGEGEVVESGDAGGGVVQGVGGAAVVAQDLPALQGGEGVLDTGPDVAVGGVAALLPVG